METPALKRGILGYSRKSVREVLTDRDMAIVQESNRARDAEERVGEISAELAAARKEAADQATSIRTAEASVARLRADLDTTTVNRAEAERRIGELETRGRELESELSETAERVLELQRSIDAAESAAPSTLQGLTEVLEATQRAVARLLDEARRNAERELHQTELARDDLRHEIDRLESWRDRLMPMTQAVGRSIDEAIEQAAAIGERLREVVVPATAAMGDLAGRLSELAESSQLPRAEERTAETGPVIRLEEARFDTPDEEEESLPEAPSGVKGPDRTGWSNAG